MPKHFPAVLEISIRAFTLNSVLVPRGTSGYVRRSINNFILTTNKRGSNPRFVFMKTQKFISTSFRLTQGKVYKMPFGHLDIQLMYVQRNGRAHKFRVVDSGYLPSRQTMSQAIYLPHSVLVLKSETEIFPIDWFWKKPSNNHKLAKSGYVEEFTWVTSWPI